MMKNLLLVCLLIVMSSSAQADISASWNAKNQKAKIHTIERDDIRYISISELSEFLGSVHHLNIRRGIGSLELINGELNYTLFSPYVTVGEKGYNLEHDILFHRGDFYAPLVNIVPVIDRLIPDNLVYSAEGNAINVYPAVYNITDITAQQKINGLMAEISLSEELKYDIVKTDDYWLVVTIYQGKIDTALFNGKRPVKAIYDTKAYQFDNSAQLSIRLRPKDFTFVSKLKDNPLRIQITIKGEGFADTVLAYSPNGGKSNEIDVIVVDPGHGGEDTGAIGPKGTQEKVINLDISKKLKKELEDEGFTVILTRDNDRFVSLADRTQIANEAGADLFISIHANASATNKKARGYISFFLSDAKTDQARAAAALENASIRFESTEKQKDYVSDIDFIILDMVQSEFLKESADLAAMIEQNIDKQTKINSRGVDQAGFFVLNKAYMPSVLVESAFISNKDDEKLLKSKKTRNNIAKSIRAAVVDFKKKYEAMK
ncbi:MAG: N-acetylmuramoyl-L-alanine amidase [candidate division Zixibacteria bacterium]|nr:N-acetylmuramoyl-L-alanine amidase [candidate division Zixibacteria bacterium]